MLEAKVQRLLRVLSTTTFHQVCTAVPVSAITLLDSAGVDGMCTWHDLLGNVTPPAAVVQALVFCNSQPDAQALADRLCSLGYPAAFVSGSHAQVGR